MANIKAKVSGGFGDRMLLNSDRRFTSKGRIEMLVTINRVETLRNNQGYPLEVAILDEASHYPLLEAQRAVFQAQERSNQADLSLKTLASNKDIMTPTLKKSNAVKELSEELNRYAETHQNLPNHIKKQSLWITSELYNICGELEQQGVRALTSKMERTLAKSTSQRLNPVIKQGMRIDCKPSSLKRMGLDYYKGMLEMTLFQPQKKPKGSAFQSTHEISWEAHLDTSGEIRLTMFMLDPSKSSDPVLTEAPPSLERGALAKRYQVYKNQPSLKMNYNVCEQGIEVYKGPKSTQSAGHITSNDIITSFKAHKGWLKIERFKKPTTYLPESQTCIYPAIQSDRVITLHTANHHISKISTFEAPSHKARQKDVQDADVFIYEHNMGEDKKWSQGWILDGDDAGQKIYIPTEYIITKPQ